MGNGCLSFICTFVNIVQLSQIVLRYIVNGYIYNSALQITLITTRLLYTVKYLKYSVDKWSYSRAF